MTNFFTYISPNFLKKSLPNTNPITQLSRHFLLHLLIPLTTKTLLKLISNFQRHVRYENLQRFFQYQFHDTNNYYHKYDVLVNLLIEDFASTHQIDFFFNQFKDTIEFFLQKI